MRIDHKLSMELRSGGVCWLWTQNFEPHSYHFCFMARCSVILEKTLFVIKLYLTGWEKLLSGDALGPMFIHECVLRQICEEVQPLGWEATPQMNGLRIFYFQQKRKHFLHLRFFLERLGFFAALLDTMPSSKSLRLTVHVDALTPACCHSRASSAPVMQGVRSWINFGNSPSVCWTFNNWTSFLEIRFRFFILWVD